MKKIFSTLALILTLNSVFFVSLLAMSVSKEELSQLAGGSFEVRHYFFYSEKVGK